MSPLALSLRLLAAQPDERLLALASSGHEPAFEALVRRYRRQLLAYCRRLTTPRANAEDVLQQALMQAWSALSRGVEVHDARAWLYRIVHNAAISAARAAGQQPGQLGQAITPLELEQVVEDRLAAREALAGLAALPALQREVMVGTALDGRSHDELASSLGLTSGSIRGLVYRARAALRAAAAAFLPGPLIEWAARPNPGAGTGSFGAIEAVAGGGSAGVAATILKGGAIVTVAGALAGTAAVVVSHPVHHLSHPARAGSVNAAPASPRIIELAARHATPVADVVPASPAAVSRSPVTSHDATVGVPDRGARSRSELESPERTRTSEGGARTDSQRGDGTSGQSREGTDTSGATGSDTTYAGPDSSTSGAGATATGNTGTLGAISPQAGPGGTTGPQQGSAPSGSDGTLTTPSYSGSE